MAIFTIEASERENFEKWLKEHDAKVRADAIDEFIELYDKFCTSDIACGGEECIGKFCPRCFRDNFMEQFKENK